MHDTKQRLSLFWIFALLKCLYSVIIWQAWTWAAAEAAVRSERIVRQSEAGITSS
jgi:hypothetical protein